jgi:hypothetical protein
LAVKAALEGDYESLYHSCLLDPLTAAVLAPHEIRNMVDEMVEVQRVWLPQFKDKKQIYPGYKIGRIKIGEHGKESDSMVEEKIGHYD